MLSVGNTLIDEIDKYLEKTRDDSTEQTFKIRCASFEEKCLAWLENTKQNRAMLTKLENKLNKLIMDRIK